MLQLARKGVHAIPCACWPQAEKQQPEHELSHVGSLHAVCATVKRETGQQVIAPVSTPGHANAMQPIELARLLAG